MADEIRPALTPEEWRYEINQSRRSLLLMSPDSPAIYGPIMVDASGGDLTNDYKHRFAAKCLYGQPFGFTQEDVEALRRVANVRACGAVADGVTDDTPAFQRAIRLASLADRIAALLPPTNTDA